VLTWVAPIIVFGLVVFVHELGHFIAAKLMGVYTPRFSIGFGPSLLKKRYGETEYVLAALPLGGYVRMASREDEATAFLEGGSENSATEANKPADGYDPEAMIPFGPKPIPEERWFESKSLPARLFIMLAGVTMNALLALVITIGIFAYYGKPHVSTVADELLPGKPAVLAGFLPGDSVAAINGAPVASWDAMVEQVGASAGVPLRFTLVRKGAPVDITVTPIGEPGRDPVTRKRATLGRIGVAPRMNRVGVPFGEAVVEGWSTTMAMGGAVFDALSGLFSRKVSLSELGGPIAIAQTSVQAARGGLESLLFLLALISINVAVFNLLPIPILDGGQIVLNIAETIKGSAFSTRTREYILRAGLAIIGLLFVVVMFNDINRNLVGMARFFGRLFGA